MSQPTLPRLQGSTTTAAEWEVTYGVWHPRDELVFAQVVAEVADLEQNPPAFDSLFRAWSIGAMALGGGVVGGVFMALTKAMGIHPETAKKLPELLRARLVPNPTTSRPANGQPNVPDSVPGWCNLQPWEIDRALLPACRVSPAATMAVFTAGPSRANLAAYLAKYRSVYACAGCAPPSTNTLATIAYLEAAIRQKDIQSGAVSPTTAATADVNTSPAAILARLRGAPAPSAPVTSSTSAPVAPPTSAYPWKIVGGIAAVFALGYALTQRR